MAWTRSGPILTGKDKEVNKKGKYKQEKKEESYKKQKETTSK